MTDGELIISLIDKEIYWCEEYIKTAGLVGDLTSPDYKNGFIKGLKQAKILAEGLEQTRLINEKPKEKASDSFWKNSGPHYNIWD